MSYAFLFKYSDVDRKRLSFLAHKAGKSRAALLRALVNAEFERHPEKAELPHVCMDHPGQLLLLEVEQ